MFLPIRRLLRTWCQMRAPCGVLATTPSTRWQLVPTAPQTSPCWLSSSPRRSHTKRLSAATSTRTKVRGDRSCSSSQLAYLDSFFKMCFFFFSREQLWWWRCWWRSFYQTSAKETQVTNPPWSILGYSGYQLPLETRRGHFKQSHVIVCKQGHDFFV